MIVNMAKSRKKGSTARQFVSRKIHNTLNYIADGNKASEQDIFTNCSSIDVEKVHLEMDAWRDLNPKITDPTRHKIFSPEVSDRKLNREEWQRVIDIYREERGLNDAPYFAVVHNDGHAGRHQQHMHLFFIRIQGNGKAVSDQKDMKVDFSTARRVEKELGLSVNKNPSGRRKSSHVQRDRAAMRKLEKDGQLSNQTLKDQPWRVHPEIVSMALSQSSSAAQLKAILDKRGIEVKFSYRQGEIYGWKLRNHGQNEWTSGSKLTASNDFGWKKVADVLESNKQLFEQRKHDQKQDDIKSDSNTKGRIKGNTIRPKKLLPAARSVPARSKPKRIEMPPHEQLQNLEESVKDAFSFFAGLIESLSQSAAPAQVKPAPNSSPFGLTQATPQGIVNRQGNDARTNHKPTN